jgi:hypothetical protein
MIPLTNIPLTPLRFLPRTGVVPQRLCEESHSIFRRRASGPAGRASRPCHPSAKKYAGE